MEAKKKTTGGRRPSRAEAVRAIREALVWESNQGVSGARLAVLLSTFVEWATRAEAVRAAGQLFAAGCSYQARKLIDLSNLANEVRS